MARNCSTGILSGSGWVLLCGRNRTRTYDFLCVSVVRQVSTESMHYIWTIDSLASPYMGVNLSIFSVFSMPSMGTASDLHTARTLFSVRVLDWHEEGEATPYPYNARENV
jgi:hypothetical protein